jgi:hypothetical protein
MLNVRIEAMTPNIALGAKPPEIWTNEHIHSKNE